MAKLLTPPEWYDQNGNLNNMLNCPSGENSVSLMAGGDNNANNSVAIGWNSGCQGGSDSVAIGSGTYIEGGSNSVAIGSGNVSGSGNVFVGKNSGGGTESSPINNSVAIGFGATVAGDLQIQIGSPTANYSVIGFGSYKPYLLQFLGVFSKENVGVIGAPTTIDDNTLNNADIVECDIEYNNMRKVITAYKAQDTFTNIKVSTGMYLATPSSSSGSDSLVSFWFGWSSGSGWQLGSQKLTFSTSSTSFVKIEKQDNATIQGITLRCKCYKIIQNTVG